MITNFHMMISASIAFMLWGLFDLLRFGDYSHRREIAARIFISWSFMAVAMFSMNREYKQKLSHVSGVSSGQSFAFTDQGEVRRVPDADSGDYVVRTQAGNVVSVSGSGRSTRGSLYRAGERNPCPHGESGQLHGDVVYRDGGVAGDSPGLPRFESVVRPEQSGTVNY